jgi:hypothetical protein
MRPGIHVGNKREVNSKDHARSRKVGRREVPNPADRGIQKHTRQ